MPITTITIFHGHADFMNISFTSTASSSYGCITGGIFSNFGGGSRGHVSSITSRNRGCITSGITWNFRGAAMAIMS